MSKQTLIVRRGRVQPSRATPTQQEHLRGSDADPASGLSPTAIIDEVVGIDQELTTIYEDLKDVDNLDAAITLTATAQTQVGVLKLRSELLFRCLNKVLPDKKAIAAPPTWDGGSLTTIPDDLLEKIAHGTASEEDVANYSALMDDADE